MQRVPQFVIGLTFLAVPFEMLPQQSPTSSTTAAETSLSPEDEAESYEIYSTVLKVNESAVLEWTIVQETRAFQMCLEPAPDQQFIYRPNDRRLCFEEQKKHRSPTEIQAERVYLRHHGGLGQGEFHHSESAREHSERNLCRFFRSWFQPRSDARIALSFCQPLRRLLFHG